MPGPLSSFHQIDAASVTFLDSLLRCMYLRGKTRFREPVHRLTRGIFIHHCARKTFQGAFRGASWTARVGRLQRHSLLGNDSRSSCCSTLPTGKFASKLTRWNPKDLVNARCSSVNFSPACAYVAGKRWKDRPPENNLWRVGIEILDE